MLFPIFIILISPNKRFTVLLILILLQFFLPRPADQSKILSMVRFDAILWGVIIYLFIQNIPHLNYRRLQLKKSIYGYCITWFFLLLIISIPILLKSYIVMTGVLDLVCAGLVFIAASEGRSIRILPEAFNDIMLWLGSRSYSIYLAHIPIFFTVRECFFRWYPDFTVLDYNDLFFGIFFMSLLFVFSISELTHRFIEMPLLLKGRKIAFNYEFAR